jgi:hypothetical protein
MIETSRPIKQDCELWRGETVDMEWQFHSYGSALSVTGATCVLHVRTNGMEVGRSIQVTGSVGRASSMADASNGWASVRINTDATFPTTASRFTYSLEVAGAEGRLLRATGTFILYGSARGDVVAPGSLALFDPAGSAQAVSNALAGTLLSAQTNLFAHVDSVSNALATTLGQRIDDTTNGAALGATALQPGNAALLSVADARRIVQADTNAWISVANGTGVLYVVAISTVVTADPTRLIIVGGSNTWGVGVRAYHQDSDTTLSDGTVFSATSSNTWTHTVMANRDWVIHSNATVTVEDPTHALLIPLAVFPAALAGWYNGATDGDASFCDMILAYGSTTNSVLVTNSFPIATAPGTVIRIATHDADPGAHADRPTFEAVTNIVAGYAAPSFPHLDVGTGQPVNMVISNCVLYLF